MGLTYQVETWATTWREMEPYWAAHWREVSDHQRYGLAVNADLAAYQALEEHGMLHVVTVRDQGQLVGYATYVLQGHLHYAGILHAYGTDLYYLAPAYRKGLAGYRLFQVIERTLQERGCRYLIHRTKTWKDMSRLFERLGYVEVERAFAKGFEAPAEAPPRVPAGEKEP